jgi:hypothetical protein
VGCDCAGDFFVELQCRTDAIRWGGLIRAQGEYTHEGWHVSFEAFVTGLRSLVEVDFGLGAWLDD